ncbi:hypothetical protein PS874_06291 [Pseudomonas fluorescens]|nr:hypothetical protein PS874_06291 [Pseudomonas fluorescens]
MSTAKSTNAESDLGARLNSEYPQGYLKALYDIQRIQPSTYTRLDALAKVANG